MNFTKLNLSFLILLILTVSADIHLNAQVERPIGTNLTGIQDWSTEYVFVDVFNMSRAWIPHEDRWDAPWSSEVNIPLGTNGYPLEIPYDNGVDPPQVIRTLMYFGDLANHYPEGNYRLIASGTGRISLWGGADGAFDCPVDTMVEVNSENGGIALEIEVSNVNDPVRNIRFIMPGFHDSWATEPFHPDFLDFVKDFQVIRFMDWMKTNGSVVSEWSDRNTSEYFSQTLSSGIAYEYIVDLCNRMKKDAWICIPHAATDDFIYEMANFFQDHLDPDLKIYLEYSNEVWNGIFLQNQYSQEMGDQLGYSGEPWEKGWQFYVKRTFDIFRIFEEVFDNDERLVKVLSGQAANSWLNNHLIEYSRDPIYNPDETQADAFGIAPYFGGSVADAIGNAGLAGSITVEAILDSMELALPESFHFMDDNKIVADDNEMELICYEAGQHLVASYLYNNDESFVDKLMEANRHPRMRDLYCAYLDHWYDQTQGGLLCNFSSHGTYSKWGSWGVKEFMDELDAPKYVALKDCAFSYNDTSSPVITENNGIPAKLYPNPSKQSKIHIEGDFKNPELFIFDMQGHLIKSITEKDLNQITIELNERGNYMILLKDNGINRWFKLLRM